MFGDEYLRELRKDREDEASRMDGLVYAVAIAVLVLILTGVLA